MGDEEDADTTAEVPTPFRAAFEALYEAQYPRVFRLLQRLTGDRERAADLAQETFVRLHERREMPLEPAAWLVTVALNLMRNERATRSRRARLLLPLRGERLLGDAPAGPEEAGDAGDVRRGVRSALERLGERDRRLLLLHAEGYGYREMAHILELNESSIGVFLARARRAFLTVYGGEDGDAPR
jgi:RNA polymerase sigma factor (sigma-70 family)